MSRIYLKEGLDLSVFEQGENADFISDLIKKGKGAFYKLGKPTPLFKGREDEVSAVLETLSKKRMRNCVLVGEAGIGKTEIAKKAIAKCKNADFLALDASLLQANCTLVGMFEQRVAELITPIAKHNKKSKRQIALFVDEIHVLWNLGRNEFVGTVSFGDMIKPYLSDGSLSIIGATTKEEYDRIIKKDKALLRRLPPIFVKGAGDEETEKIVKAFGEKALTEDVCKKIVEQSKRITYLNNPDCSLELADRLLAKAIVEGFVPEEGDVEEIASLMVENG